MSVSGQFVKTFSEANLALTTNVHMNDDSPKFFKVLDVEGSRVVLKNTHNNTDLILEIAKDTKSEYVSITHSGMYEELFRQKPSVLKILPFKGVMS